LSVSEQQEAMQAADAVVIGGGFYGCSLALVLKRQHGLNRVMLVEREAALMTRASFANQARVHNGYHYPRSFTTAYRSRINLPRFREQYRDCIDDSFTKLYAIASRGSKVTARQFAGFCQQIGAPLREPSASLRRLFNPRLVEQVFAVEEFAFDAVKLAHRLRDELESAGVEVLLGHEVLSLARQGEGAVASIRAKDGGALTVAAPLLLDCTYGRLGQFGSHPRGLKYELAEMALVRVPEPLQSVGVTVMDGPFFSLMPFPARGLHTLSHVRYTPHLSWQGEDEPQADPYDVLAHYERQSRFPHMLRDASRFLPILSEMEREDSLYEVKVVLSRNETDDGRPILFEADPALPGLHTVLGGKIDNIYDIEAELAGLRAEWKEPADA